MDWAREDQRGERRNAGKAAGADVRRARKDRADYGTRSAAEVRQLREQAARDSSLCADCFAPIGPHDSVTMVGRAIHIPAREGPFSHKAYDKFISVPICVTCWLVQIEHDAEGIMREFSSHRESRHRWQDY